ncbi:MAG TPA: substrate-binding domain-containing protein [Spirochaetia bacterium]|nr:substrate-binding domain-containing protein [Spirochaetia bacterium]
MNRKALLVVLTALVFSFAAASSIFATGQGEKGTSPSKPEYTFYFVSHGGPGDPYWQAFINGVNDAAKSLNVKIVYVYPQKEGDVNELIKQLNSAIAAKPDGIGVTIDDEQGFSAPLLDAKKQGIPVIAFDTVPDPSNPKPTIPYISYVGEDSRSAGQEVGRGALSAFKLASGDRVAVLNHEAGNVSLTLRSNGIKDILVPKGVTVDEVAIPGDDPAQCQAIIQNYLAKYPAAKALLTMGPLSYLPASKVLETGNLVGKVGLVGWDITAEAITMIKSGEMAFTANEQPYYIATTTAYLLYMNVKYHFDPQPLFNTGLGKVDKSNIDAWADLVKAGKG